jgi:hypothetical protein
VLPDEQPEQKTASDQQDWDKADEKALDEEVKGD